MESGQYDPETLLDLAISNLALVTDRQPSLNKASTLLVKVCAGVQGGGGGGCPVGSGVVLGADTHSESAISFPS